MYTYVVGDIHGMLDKLERLLDRIPFDEEMDTLAFVGDYIDRGPDSRKVVDFLLDLMDRGVKLVCLKGNHEQMLLDFLGGHDEHFYLFNGGDTTIADYRAARLDPIVVPRRHLAFFEGLPCRHEMDDFILVHAGLRPGVALEDQIEEDLLWIRYDFIHSGYDFGKKIVFGHTHFRSPYVDRNKIGIDTGAVYGNLLTCVRLPDVIFYSV